MRHLYSIADLDRQEIIEILDRSEILKSTDRAIGIQPTGLVVGLFFFQSSTRTRAGFHAAAARLGAAALPLDWMRHGSGMSEAEAPVDAFRSVSAYCDLIVLRHEFEQEFLRMIGHATAPVINAGCGTRHHPTQALVDLFHIRSRLGRLDGLRWGIAGDLLRARAARSLVDCLGWFEVAELRLMSPPNRTLPAEELDLLPAERVRLLDRLDPSGLDVLYMAGYPEGLRPDCTSREERWRFRLTAEMVRQLPTASLILDPLPRIDEIEGAVDDLPQASYFEQSRNGQFVRMAVLERALSRESAGSTAVQPPNLIKE